MLYYVVVLFLGFCYYAFTSSYEMSICSFFLLNLLVRVSFKVKERGIGEWPLYVSGTIASAGTQMSTVLNSAELKYRLVALLSVWIYTNVMIKSYSFKDDSKI